MAPDATFQCRTSAPRGASGGRVSHLRSVTRLDLEELSQKTNAGPSTTLCSAQDERFVEAGNSRRTTWLTMIRSSAGGITRTVTGESLEEMTAGPRTLLRAGS